MKGKERCKILREIRQKIATDNDISLITNECSYKGECKGTCPKCEAEVRYLERELERKRRMGEFVTIAGLAIGSVVGLASCHEEEYSGDMAVTEKNYDTNASDLEIAHREAVFRNLIDYAKDHPIYLEDTAGVETRWEQAYFTITSDGHVTNINTGEDNVVTIAFQKFLNEVPKEILTGLSENCIYMVRFYNLEDQVYIGSNY